MTKSIARIDQKMENMDKDSFRYHVLETSKNFKTSWIKLGQALCTVWKDKKYREWGYQTFDTYVVKEIGIRKQTSLKLLRSYQFLEKEEPVYLSDEYVEQENVANLPSYESVDVLRLAKKKDIDDDEYISLKEKVFMKGKDAHEVRRDLTSLIKQREELNPDEAFQKSSAVKIRRLLGTLKALKNEAEYSKILPSSLIKDLNRLISKMSEAIN